MAETLVKTSTPRSRHHAAVYGDWYLKVLNDLSHVLNLGY